MGVEGRPDDQQGLGASWGTSLQTGRVEQRNCLWRAEMEEHGCRGEGSRSLGRRCWVRIGTRRGLGQETREGGRRQVGQWLEQ